MASFLSSARAARKGGVCGLTDATLPVELEQRIARSADTVSALVDSAREWCEAAAAAPSKSCRLPARDHPLGHEPCGSMMKLMQVFVCSPAIGGPAGPEGLFQLWRGHCADRFLRRTHDTNADLLIDGFISGDAEQVRRTIEGACRSEKIADLLLDSGDRGESLQTYCFAASLKPGLDIDDATGVRLTQIALALEWIGEVSPSSLRESSAETRERLNIAAVSKWLDENRTGASLVAAYLEGGDARGYFLTALGHFAQRRVAYATDPNLAHFHYEDPTGFYEKGQAERAWLAAALDEAKLLPNSEVDWAAMKPHRRELWRLRAYAVDASHFAPAKARVSAQEHVRNSVPWLTDHVVLDMSDAWARLWSNQDAFSVVFPFIVVVGNAFVVTDRRITIRASTAAEAVAGFVFLCEHHHKGQRQVGVPTHRPWIRRYG